MYIDGNVFYSSGFRGCGGNKKCFRLYGRLRSWRRVFPFERVFGGKDRFGRCLDDCGCASFKRIFDRTFGNPLGVLGSRGYKHRSFAENVDHGRNVEDGKAVSIFSLPPYRVSACKSLKGSFTVEAAIIIPMFLFVIVTALYHLIYFYDKALYIGAATETAAAACEMRRFDQSVSDSEIMGYFNERIEKKPVYFAEIDEKKVCRDMENICIRVNAVKRGLQIDIEGRMPDTSPEMILRYRKDLKNRKEAQEIGD